MMDKILVLYKFVLFYYVFIITSAVYECPPNGSLEVCTCDPPGIIKCSEVPNIEILQNDFMNMSNSSFQSLEIHSSSFLYIPSTILEATSFSSILVKDCSMTALFNQPPVSDSVTEFTLVDSRFQRAIDWSLFANFELELLSIQNTGITKLVRTFGNGLPQSIREIYVEEPELVRLSNNFLQSLENLEKITINKGVFRRLQAITFPQSIKSINFNYGHLEFLPDGFFNDLPNLQDVSVKNNSLTALKEEVFAPLRKAEVGGNPFECDCSVKWVLNRKTDFPDFKCINPEELEGKDITDLNDSDFASCS